MMARKHGFQFTLSAYQWAVPLMAIFIAVVLMINDSISREIGPTGFVVIATTTTAVGTLSVVAQSVSRQSAYFVPAGLASILVFMIAVLLWFAEVVWLALVLAWTVVIVSRSRSTRVRLTTVALAASILIAHAQGFRLYGSAVIYDNRPVLAKTHVLATIEPPNWLVGKDGTRFAVKGLKFNDELYSLSPDSLLAIASCWGWFHFPQEEFRFGTAAKESTPSGVAFELVGEYGCGNTFFPTLLPERLPRYFAVDVGECLMAAKLATKL
jgi:hypothetical protein